MGNIIWELDFYSRPILDEQEKKVWEVLICESPLNTDSNIDSLFRYAKFAKSTEVNSVWLREAITEAIDKFGQTPQKIRFFRRQMNNMITKACKDLGLAAQPSRRTYYLNIWLQERMEDFYPNQPGFQTTAIGSATVQFEVAKPKPLQEALMGEKWAFVSLEASAFAEMGEWSIDFGEGFPLSIMDKKGVTAALEPTTPIAGIIIFSPRAFPLAAWISGLDLAFIRVEGTPPTQLLLETGAGDSWILENLKDKNIQKEAQEFAQAKEKAQQVHFLAVQSNPKSETFAGFWLLQEVNLP